MLNQIKQMIQEKQSFLESTDIIFEDASGINLDDQIILGEASADEFDEDPELPEEPVEVENPMEDKPVTPEEVSEPVGDIMDQPIPGTEVEKPVEPEVDIMDQSIGNNDQDVLDAPVEGGMESSEELPEPVGAQTGEPVNPLNDIMNIEVDLGSNTVKDVLPVPPAAAHEVVPSEDEETPTQHVDAGFSKDAIADANGEEPTLGPAVEPSPEAISPEPEVPVAPVEEPVAEEPMKESSMSFIGSYFESIGLDANRVDDENDNYEESSEKPYEETATKTEPEPVIEPEEESESDEKKNEEKEEVKKESSELPDFSLDNIFSEAITMADGGDEAPSEKPADEEAPVEEPVEGEKSAVTAAVEDKVAESEAEEETFTDDIGEADMSGGSESKMDILKKLSNITKSIEDAKKAVMNSMQ